MQTVGNKIDRVNYPLLIYIWLEIFLSNQQNIRDIFPPTYNLMTSVLG